MTIGMRIRSLRTERSITIKEFAQNVGLTPQAVCNYEAGIREPSIEILKKICDFFDVSADYLIGRTDSY